MYTYITTISVSVNVYSAMPPFWGFLSWANYKLLMNFKDMKNILKNVLSLSSSGKIPRDVTYCQL